VQGSQIGSVAASQITGTVQASQIGSVAASAITGTVQGSQIGSVAASQITGTVQASQIGSIAASAISGAIAASQITSVSASVINGVIVTSQLAATLLNSMGLVVQNGGFESGFVGWQQHNCTLQTSGAYTGNTCVALSALTPGSYAALFTDGTISCRPGDQIYLEAYMKSDAGVATTGYIFVRFFDASGAYLTQVAGACSPSVSWQPVSCTATAPSSASNYLLLVEQDASDSHGSWYVDAIYACRVISAAQISSVSASTINGLILANQISQISASQITGTVQASQIGSVAASQITGTVQASQIGSVAAAQITGTVQASQIGSVAASQITGTIAASHIAGVSASAIVGSIVASQIDHIDASQITVVGTLSVASATAGLQVVVYAGDGRSSKVMPGQVNVFDTSGVLRVALSGPGMLASAFNSSGQVVVGFGVNPTFQHGVLTVCNNTGDTTFSVYGNTGNVVTHGYFDFEGGISATAGAFLGYVYVIVDGSTRRIPYYV
jgi:hypothetical protein